MKEDLQLFELLKSEVVGHFTTEFPYVSTNSSLWTGMQINYFTESLFQKTKGNISDRWFYTYFKNQPDKIPRGDMLNILAEYVGYENWDDFKLKNLDKVTNNSDNSIPDSQNSNSNNDTSNFFKNKKVLLLSASVLLIIAIFLYAYIDRQRHTYVFYFRDKDRETKNTKYMKNLDVIIPNYQANPYQTSDSLGKITIPTHQDTLKIVINSPFYKRDTFRINLKNSDGEEILDLTPNDYALMMYYYSHSNQTSIENRRRRLNQLIANDALIYQVYDNENYGQEILSKEQYINLMTTPTESLKNLEILENQTNKNGITTKIKFKIVPNE